MRTVKPQRVVLIGPDRQENLALQYLASSAEAAGHEVRLLAFNSRCDLETCADAVVGMSPDVVGLGMAFQSTVGDYLQLIQTLRFRGYGGHITCGGHVATFCYPQLLRDAPIDTVVRHDGEQTLVALLNCLGNNRAPRNIAGLVWRASDGSDGIEVGPPRRPVENLDTLAPPKRRVPPLRVGGVPAAFVLSSRGCSGECAYCSIRAYSRDMGGPHLRLRDVETVAEELAGRYREDGVRIFCVQDDLFVLPHEAKAVARLRELHKALRARGVEQAVFWIKGRPDSITEKVVEASAELGAIHLFIGVESASSERLKYLGRTHRPEDNRAAIALCRKYRIRPSFNLMLFDPDCRLEELSASLDLVEDNLDLPWNICRTEVYPGTRLYDRLKNEGRLQGDYRSYGYCMADHRAETTFRILRVSFHQRALAAESLMNRLISLSFARQVHEVFFPGRITEALNDEVEHLTVAAHRDAVRQIRSTIDFACRVDPEDTERIRDFAVDSAMEVNARDLKWFEQCERLWRQLSARGEVLLARATPQKAGQAGQKTAACDRFGADRAMQVERPWEA